jgi:hypothetical protein
MGKRKEVTATRAANGWTKEHIQHLLLNSDKAVGRALLQIYARQTEDEQRSKDTRHHNSMGFSGVDGEFLSDIAERYKRYNTLTEKQLAIVRRKMLKYWKQLLEIASANEKGPAFEVPAKAKKPETANQTCLAV